MGAETPEIPKVATEAPAEAAALLVTVKAVGDVVVVAVSEEAGVATEDVAEVVRELSLIHI